MTKQWLDMVAYHALGNRETQEATYDIAMLALQRGIPGDFVECGVFKGASSAIMARAIMDYAESRYGLYYHLAMHGIPRIHLFDSFEGLPAATPTDAEIWAHHQDKTGESKCSVPEVQAYMQKWSVPPELLVYHPGWFQQTIPLGVSELDNAVHQIAVLRLDADLYTSTSIAMKLLYPLVSPGGWVICDDYHLSGCKKAVHEVVNPGPIYWRKM